MVFVCGKYLPGPLFLLVVVVPAGRLLLLPDGPGLAAGLLGLLVTVLRLGLAPALTRALEMEKCENFTTLDIISNSCREKWTKQQIRSKQNKSLIHSSDNHTCTHFIFSSRGFMRYKIIAPI